MPMLRNIDSRFSAAPMSLDISRSRFNRGSDLKTTFNAGDLVPIFCDEVLPGDTFDLRAHYVCRMATPIFPVMDNAYLETFFFFVPTRLVWDHWKEFNGENNETYWTQPTEYLIPQVKFPEDYQPSETDPSMAGFQRGSVADYFGIPTDVCPQGGDGASSINALPFRAYCKLWNDWFRDQNTMQPAYYPTDDSTVDGAVVRYWDGSAGNEVVSDPRLTAYRGGALLKVSKYHDYFTSCLPAPQKGPDVSVQGDFAGVMPVASLPQLHHEVYAPLQLRKWPADNGWNQGSSYDLRVNATSGTDGTVSINADTKDDGAPNYAEDSRVYPSNLFVNYDSPDADLGGVKLFVNDLRLAFQIQRLYEKDARGGSRYIEVIKSHFGVDSPDARLQRSEYLGGTRQAINVSQVVQTSATDTVSPQGNTSAFSLTNGSEDVFVKSFTEHGYIIGVACVRTDHTYQQGLNRMWSRKRRFDFYWPVLANIGEQAVLKKEILLTSDDAVNDQAFGYQEAWADYRYKPSLVTGAFRSNVNGSLDSWHYADYFDPTTADTFVIDEAFTLETSANISRTLAVQSDLEDQFIADFWFDADTTRVMPLYSVPGLIDHH